MRAILALAMAGLCHRRWRAVLIAVAVALGVTVMVTLQAVVFALDRAAAPLNAGPDAGADWIVGSRTGGLPGALRSEIAAMPEVEWVAPRIVAPALVDLGGEVTRASLYAMDPGVEAGAGLLRLEEGNLPGPDSPGVALRADVARAAGLAPGDPVAFYTPDGRRLEWPLTGLTGREGAGGSGGFIGLIVHHARAADLGLMEEASRLLVGVADEAASDWGQARRGLLSSYGAAAWEPPPPYSGKTGAVVMLMVFSALGPVLSIFLIQNAFTLAMRRRLQELALWRTVGASQRQVAAALLCEGALLGLAGGGVGLAVGLWLARAVIAYILGFSSLGAGQSLGALQVGLPVWVALTSLAVAMAVSVAAALRPALAARQVSAAALRHPVHQPDPPVGGRYAIAWGAAAVLSLAISLSAGNAGTGLLLAALHFSGLMALLPSAVQAISRRFPLLPGPYGAAAALGARRMGEASRRAVGGARTLMVATGLLVGFGAISAAAWDATAAALRADPSDLQVRGGITPAVEAVLAATPGVADIHVLSRFEAAVAGNMLTAWAVGAPEPAAGLAPAPAAGEVLVGSKLAREQGLQTGDVLEVRPVGREPGKALTVMFTVAGVVPEDWDGPSTFYIAMSDAQRHFVPIPVTARVALEPGTSPDAAGAELRGRLPGLKVETAEERWEAARRAHREKLGTFTAILYLLAGFGALGVIQTSLLSIYEQLPELALLRAAGATFRQNAMIVLVQSFLPGSVGGLLGAAGGALFGFHLVRWFADWRGAALSGGLSGWYTPALAILGLSLLSSLPAVLWSARLPVARALQ